MFELEFLNGARAGVVIPINRNLRAGRLPDCDLEVPDAMAGRHHMDIMNNGNGCDLIDNKSANGLYVNEDRISSHHLNVGDIIRIGETRLRYQMNVASTMGGGDGA
ncbi:MAG: FHA domain-containing protein, partial [Planctomycetes bacterium]|nr:FHA domain-containing protein [Planctomycetota bacterium]